MPETTEDFTLITERLIVRLATPDDAVEVVRFYRENWPFLAPWSPERSAEYFTEGYWRRQAAAWRTDAVEGKSFCRFILRRDAPRVVVGAVNISAVLRGAAQFANLGYSLAEGAQGNGYMAEAVAAVVRDAFENRCLHRIQANYIPRNERSGRLLRRLGFVVEGYARDYLRIAGRWEDHILTSITNPKWHPEEPE